MPGDTMVQAKSIRKANVNFDLFKAKSILVILASRNQNRVQFYGVSIVLYKEEKTKEHGSCSEMCTQTYLCNECDIQCKKCLSQ